MPAKLTPKQKKFIDEYLIDLNATQAAIRAGYSQKTAFSIGVENLRKPLIQAELQKAMKRRQERTEITADRVLKEYARIAFSDVRKLYDRYGELLDVPDLDDDTAAALVGLDVVREDSRGDTVTYTKKYKMADKLRALEMLGRHLGMFSEKPTVELPEGGVILIPAVRDA